MSGFIFTPLMCNIILNIKEILIEIMNLSFLLLIGALFASVSFILSLLIVKKVFDEEYRRPWFFITLSVLLYAPSQILRYLNIQSIVLIPNIESLIYSLEFASSGLLMYALLLEFIILKYIKGRFVKMRFVPVQEGRVDGTLSIDVSKAQTYFAYKKDHNHIMDSFKEAVQKGYQGFLITQFSPLNIRKDYGLVKTPILLISSPENSLTNTVIDSNAQSIDALHFNTIIKDIDTFYEQAKSSFIVFELDMILRYNSFEIVIELIEYLKSKNQRYEGVLLLTVNEDVTSYANISRLKEICNELE